MKKSFFGYNVSEVDVAIGALREENESLNATITTLKTQIKNSIADNGAKANLLEADLKKNEESLKKISEENQELKSQITSLSKESEVWKQQNAELSNQIEHLHIQNEDLNHQISDFRNQIIELTAQGSIADSELVEALQSQLDAEKEAKTALEQALNVNKEELAVAISDLEETKSKLELLANDWENEKAQMSASMEDDESMKEELKSTRCALETMTNELANAKALVDQKAQDVQQAHKELETLKIQLEDARARNSEQADKLAAAITTQSDDFNHVKEMLASAYATLNEKTIELESAQKEIEQLKDELSIAKVAVEEQAKIKATEKKQLANLNQASEISFQAYYDMAKIRNEVVEYIHEQMKEYYQLVNDNSIKMRTAIERRQSEYNQMIREFSAKASEFRVSLSNIEGEYNNMADFSMNIDKISNRMNEIMDNFIEDCSAYLKKKEEDLKSDDASHTEEKSSGNRTTEIIKKPFVFKISS